MDKSMLEALLEKGFHYVKKRSKASPNWLVRKQACLISSGNQTEE